MVCWITGEMRLKGFGSGGGGGERVKEAHLENNVN